MEVSYAEMEQQRRFPRLVAETLSGRKLVLPDSLDGKLALVLLAFRRHAQPVVDSWVGPAQRRYGSCHEFTWFELPMLAGGWRTISGFIDGGMRSGIDQAHHDHVATFYGDSRRHCEALAIRDPNTAHACLIDGDGTVHWMASGWATNRKLEELYSALDYCILADPLQRTAPEQGLDA